MAKGKKTLVMPDMKLFYGGEDFNEKMTYIELPPDMADYSVSQDVHDGAVHLKEIERLCSKDNFSRIICITADNLEMGVMAVKYLAMHLESNIEHKKTIDYGMEEDNVWIESPDRLPIIPIQAVASFLDNDDDLYFDSGPFGVKAVRKENDRKPVWLSLRREPVCITILESFSSISYDEAINYFSNNRQVYLLFVKNTESDDDYEWQEKLGIISDRNEKFIAFRNDIILSSVADEATVSFGTESPDLYYKSIFKRSLHENRIKVTRGFAYDRIINLAKSISEDTICQTLAKILKYAIKDRKIDENSDIVLGNSDFDFIDRFARTGAKDKNEKTARERLDSELEGLDDIKQQVYDIINVMKFNKMRQKMGMKGSAYHNVHVMLGAPGTAKTTVATIMGQMMFEENLLSDNRMICINGAELKGKYVGHSAPKTKSLFEDYDVIVIDEAYSIVDSVGGADSFGTEAIAQLIIELEKHSTDKLVIFAGYGGDVKAKNNKMKLFLEANPGIRSRITSTFFFRSYSAEDMTHIFKKLCENSNYRIQDESLECVKKYFKTRVSAEDFGNGREARVLLETAIVFAARRTMTLKKDKYSEEDMSVLLKEDIVNAIKKMGASFETESNKSFRLGFEAVAV